MLHSSFCLIIFCPLDISTLHEGNLMYIEEVQQNCLKNRDLWKPETFNSRYEFLYCTFFCFLCLEYIRIYVTRKMYRIAYIYDGKYMKKYGISLIHCQLLELKDPQLYYKLSTKRSFAQCLLYSFLIILRCNICVKREFFVSV